MNNHKNRPVYLNLMQFRFPATALVSGGHRISGVLLFLALPFLLYLFELSLSGPQGFEQACAWLDNVGVRLLGLVVLWSFAHHLFAGLRFLLLDMGLGLEFTTARRTALWAIGAGLLVLLAGVIAV